MVSINEENVKRWTHEVGLQPNITDQDVCELSMQVDSERGSYRSQQKVQ